VVVTAILWFLSIPRANAQTVTDKSSAAQHITLHNTQIRNFPDDARFLQIIPTVPNTPTYLELFPDGNPYPGEGNYTISSLQLFHSPYSQYPTNYEVLEMSAEVINGVPVFHINTFAKGTGVRRAFQIRVDGALAMNFPDKVAVRFALPPSLPNYTMATRPIGVPAGSLIFVSDAGDGSKFQGWDGEKWVPL